MQLVRYETLTIHYISTCAREPVRPFELEFIASSEMDTRASLSVPEASLERLQGELGTRVLEPQNAGHERELAIAHAAQPVRVAEESAQLIGALLSAAGALPQRSRAQQQRDGVHVCEHPLERLRVVEARALLPRLEAEAAPAGAE